jgi:TonB family protein
MRCFSGVALAALVAAGLGGFAQGQDAPVKVYHAGHDVTAPQLLPADFSSAIASDCGKTVSSKVRISFVIDAEGVPRNILFLQASDTALDWLAVRVASLYRFTPSKMNGASVAVGESSEMKLEGCVVQSHDASGEKTTALRLSKPPEQKFASYDGYPGKVIFGTDDFEQKTGAPSTGFSHIGNGVSPPLPTNSPEAVYPPEASRNGVNGICLVSVLVDSHGLPHPVRIIKSPPGFEQAAMDAVTRYRFKPAFKNRVQPVPAMITIEINFRKY